MPNGVKNTLKIVAFLLVFSFVFYSIQSVVVPKRDWPKSERRMTKAYRSYYQEQRDSLDYICIGSSFVFSGISPMEIYRQTKLKGYVISAPGQRAAVGYQMLKAILKTQKPQVVVADIGSLFKSLEANQNTAAWQGTIDSLPFLHIADRLSLASELAKVRGESFSSKYLIRSVLPLLQYHTNYLLGRNDYLDLHEEQVFYRKGYVAKSGVKPSPVVSGDTSANAKNDEVDEEEDDGGDALGEQLEGAVAFNRAYYEKMRDLCREKQCEFVFIKVPVNAGEQYGSNWTAERHDIARRVADEMGVEFMDMNDVDYGLDWMLDTPDAGRHLNLSGATKTSKYLAQWLGERYDQPKVTDEKLTAQWDYQLELYDWEMEFYKLQMEQDFIEYLRKAGEGDNALLVSISSGVDECWTDDMQAAFEGALGTEFDLRKSGNVGYVAYSENGKLIAEDSDKDKCTLQCELDNGMACTLTGAGGGDKDSSIDVGGTELSSKSVGIHIVVYNKELHCVVDSVYFNMHKDRVSGTHSLKALNDNFHICLMDHMYEALKEI